MTDKETYYVVVRTTTNHEIAVYGIFVSEKTANKAKHKLGAEDQLGVYSVRQVEEV